MAMVLVVLVVVVVLVVTLAVLLLLLLPQLFELVPQLPDGLLMLLLPLPRLGHLSLHFGHLSKLGAENDLVALKIVLGERKLGGHARELGRPRRCKGKGAEGKGEGRRGGEGRVFVEPSRGRCRVNSREQPIQMGSLERKAAQTWTPHQDATRAPPP